MGACCNLRLLPLAGGVYADYESKDTVRRPNPVFLPSNVWTRVECGHPSILVPLTNPTLPLQAFPGPPTTITNDVYTGEPVASGGRILLFSPGVWSVLSPGAAVNCVLLDAYDSMATLFYGGTRVLGGSLSLSLTGAGVITMAAPTSVAVGAASALAVAANANRKFLYLRNQDATATIWLGFDNNVAAIGSGEDLRPGEGLTIQAPGEAPTIGQVNAIRTPSAATLSIQEGS